MTGSIEFSNRTRLRQRVKRRRSNHHRVGAYVLTVALAAAAAGGSGGRAWGQKMPELERSRGVRVGSLAHDFSLDDLDGRNFRLDQMIGKRVIHVAFWATWCVPCISEIPKLREIYEKYHEKGLEILGVVVPINQTRDEVRAFSEKYRINYPILWDLDEKMTGRYAVASVPRNFLIGKDGIIRHADVDLPKDFEARIESLLQEKGPGPAPAR